MEVSRSRKRGFKRGEADPGCTLFPKCSPQPRTPTEFTELD